MKPLFCLIFGCKWSEWITTHTKQVYGIIDVDPLSGVEEGWYTRHFGHDKELSHCRRCGKANPAYKPVESTLVSPDPLGGK
jgi:hypothetical protein